MFNFKKASTSTTTSSNNSYNKTGNFVTPGTLNFYNTLCEQKGQKKALDSHSQQKDVQEAIEHLRTLPNYRPASSAQLEKIKNRLEDLSMPSIPTEGMSMSEASSLIEKLDAQFVAKGLDRLITKKQIEMLEKMAMCPDIPLFTIHLSDEMLERADEMQMAYDVAVHNMNVGKGDPLVVEELEADMSLFQAECQAYVDGKSLHKLDKELASNFISAYQSAYYAWFNSRASEGKRTLLKSLSARVGEAFSDEMLMQYSSKEADLMIDQLQKEMSKQYGGTLEPTAPETERGARDSVEIAKYDAEKLEEAIHNLYAMIGQQAEQDVLNNPTLYNIIDLVDLMPFYGIDKDSIVEALGNCFDEEDMALILLPYADKI